VRESQGTESGPPVSRKRASASIREFGRIVSTDPTDSILNQETAYSWRRGSRVALPGRSHGDPSAWEHRPVPRLAGKQASPIRLALRNHREAHSDRGAVDTRQRLNRRIHLDCTTSEPSVVTIRVPEQGIDVGGHVPNTAAVGVR
jgi:hypothetical protein